MYFESTLDDYRITPIISDPTNVDSDGDYINDSNDIHELSSDLVEYKSLYKNCVISKKGASIHSFIAPSSGYYRFEIYHDGFQELLLNIDGKYKSLIENYMEGYYDTRAYKFLNKGEIALIYINGSCDASYNLYITKSTAYLCGGKFADGLDTTIDVELQAEFFEAYGFDTVIYEGSTFRDIYEYHSGIYPFSHTNNEMVIINSHGDFGEVVDYSLKPIYLPYDKEGYFSQNILTLFMCCYGYGISETCFDYGARGVLYFNDSIGDSSAIYYNCLVLHSLLRNHVSFSTLENITVPLHDISGIDSVDILINDLSAIEKWISGVIYVGGDNKYNVDFTNINEILKLCEQLKPLEETEEEEEERF